jgi:16S rRNA (cytosine967-C5)-methyltransferase
MKKQQNIAENIFKLSVQALESWEQQPISIDDFLDSQPESAQTYRRSLSSILFSFFRNKGLIDLAIAKNTKSLKPRLKRILEISVTEMFFQSGLQRESAANIAVDYTKKRLGSRPAGFVNAVLRTLSKLNFEELLCQHPFVNIPGPLRKRWQKEFGTDFLKQQAEVLKQIPPFCFRVIRDQEIKSNLPEDCQPLDLPPWSKNTDFFECGSPEKILNSDWLTKGKIYIQDPAATMPLSLLKKVDKLCCLDMCAAPGGKSILLSEMGEVNLIAADRSPRRQKMTRENFHRLGLPHSIVVSSALSPAFKEASFDLILLDVPCSNSGVGRHRPDALWRFSENKLSELKDLQSSILEKALKLLKPKGRILYSTCSIEPEENLKQVKDFCLKNPQFELEKELLIFPADLHDGAYAALLSRNDL